MKKTETMNQMCRELIDNYIKQIYNAAVVYYQFEEKLKNEKSEKKDEKEKIYMITKEFLDNFKTKINYNENKALFANKDKEENYQIFEEKLKDYTLNDLEYIIFGEFNLYGDLEKVDEDFQKGFDFVNEDFLDELDFDFEEGMKDSNIDYYKNNNNVIVIFSDRSKLLINEANGKFIYNAIPSPIKELNTQNTIQKKKTFQMTNINKAKTIRDK